MRKNKTRIIISSLASILVVFYVLNFVPRNVMILASRTLPRQILDYIVNFLIFFAVVYLLITLFLYIKKKLMSAVQKNEAEN